MTGQKPRSIATYRGCTKSGTSLERFLPLRHLKPDRRWRDSYLKMKIPTTWFSIIGMGLHGFLEKQLTGILVNVAPALGNLCVRGKRELTNHGQQSSSSVSQHPQQPQREKSNTTRVTKWQSNGKRSRTSDRKTNSSHPKSNFKPSSPTLHNSNFGCPIPKHNPNRYNLVANARTHRPGFPELGKLVYVLHLVLTCYKLRRLTPQQGTYKQSSFAESALLHYLQAEIFRKYPS